METKYIVAGGVGLGALMLLLGGRQSPQNSDAATIAAASLNASAEAAANAPAVLAGISQLEQVRLAGQNANTTAIYDFMSNIDANNVQRQANFLNVGVQTANLNVVDRADARANKTSRIKIATDAQVELARIEAQKKMAEPDLGGQLLGFFDNQIGLAQMNAGSAINNSISGANQALSSLFSGGGQNSGSMLSSLGGGTGSGGSGGIDISKILPIVMAMFA